MYCRANQPSSLSSPSWGSRSRRHHPDCNVWCYNCSAKSSTWGTCRGNWCMWLTCRHGEPSCGAPDDMEVLVHNLVENLPATTDKLKAFRRRPRVAVFETVHPTRVAETQICSPTWVPVILGHTWRTVQSRQASPFRRSTHRANYTEIKHAAVDSSMSSRKSKCKSRAWSSLLASHVSRHRGDGSEMFDLLEISSNKTERATHSTQRSRLEMGESGSRHNDLPGTRFIRRLRFWNERQRCV